MILRKAVVIGYRWIADYPENTARAFEEAGVETLFLPLYHGFEPGLFHTVFPKWARIRDKLGKYCDGKILGNYRVRSMISEISRFNPDLIIVVGTGKPYLTEILKHFRERDDCKIVQWIADPIDRFPYIYENLKYCDRFYCANPFIAQEVNRMKLCRTDYLPVACMPDIDRAMDLSDEERDFYGSDVSFVGTVIVPKMMGNSRGGFFDELLAGGIDYSLKLWDSKAREVINEHPALKGYMPLRPIWGKRRTKVINSSKINLNLHHIGILGMGNLRFFQIPAAGGFQLSNKKEQKHLFEPYLDLVKHTVFFEDVKECKEIIRYYLDNEKERTEIAAYAHNLVHRRHTYGHRIRQIAEDLSFRISEEVITQPESATAQ